MQSLDYSNAALQLKEDPMMAVELVAQSMSDTVEEEGVMYVSGSALTYLIPPSLFVKFIKEGSAVKGVGKARVGDGNVGTGAKGIEAGTKISEADKVKLENWSYRPTDEEYLKHKKIFDDDKYYNQKTGEINWPLNDGFDGKSAPMRLEKGVQIDRYGSPNGNFFSPEGIPYEQRSLALHSDNADYYVYEVLRPLDVESGKIAPWFGRDGGGIQYIKYDERGRPYTINELIDEGYIKLKLKKNEGE